MLFRSTNATIPDKDKTDSITLDEAIALIEEKSGGVVAKKAPKRTSKATAKTAAKPIAAKVTKPKTVAKPKAVKKVVAKKAKT